MNLIEVVQLNFEIEVVDGLRIGSGSSGMEIGAVVQENLAVLLDPVSGLPYLPGSSIKGKLRSLAERVYGRTNDHSHKDGNPCECGRLTCKVCPIFGAHMNSNPQCAPTRIRVRDAHLTSDSIRLMKDLAREKGQFLENKTENIINRRSGTAEHPRTGERVPPGTCFNAVILLHIYEGDDGKAYLDTIRQALGLLEKADSLGASGSRGYGAIKLNDPTITTKPVSEFTVDFKPPEKI